ncbi:CMGC kinase, CDK family [Toxoplasma gondii ME49]|uniref:Cyclin-dependent kinase 2 homolog n=1 Tax=Toxoplasma gondii (strain ATCC 50611 / Me49) TaxID=508771 RepID=S8GTB3_TOXGM|nr:CMGC kinase, CDK family [Toxoplasma gondii ME49]EPT31799.1 CMGC kinase, CDK family [Toxoplasma gondii ME49]|eukprot:XP_002369414.1 CMGC kinase, CDK family [Toxoplasma gondii ME49]
MPRLVLRETDNGCFLTQGGKRAGSQASQDPTVVAVTTARQKRDTGDSVLSVPVPGDGSAPGNLKKRPPHPVPRTVDESQQQNQQEGSMELRLMPPGSRGFEMISSKRAKTTEVQTKQSTGESRVECASDVSDVPIPLASRSYPEMVLADSLPLSDEPGDSPVPDNKRKGLRGRPSQQQKNSTLVGTGSIAASSEAKVSGGDRPAESTFFCAPEDEKTGSHAAFQGSNPPLVSVSNGRIESISPSSFPGSLHPHTGDGNCIARNNAQHAHTDCDYEAATNDVCNDKEQVCACVNATDMPGILKATSDPPVVVSETRRPACGFPQRKGVPKSGPTVPKRSSAGETGDGTLISERIEPVAGDSCAGHGILPAGGRNTCGKNSRKGLRVNPKKSNTTGTTGANDVVNLVRAHRDVRIAIEADPESSSEDPHLEQCLPPIGRRAARAAHATRPPAIAVSHDTGGRAMERSVSKRFGEKTDSGDTNTQKETIVRLCDRDEQIWNEWEGVRLLGEGVYGRVYLVRNKETGEERAFKRMYLQSSRHATDDDSVAGGGVPAVVQREVASLKALRGAQNVIRLDRVFVGCRRVYLSFPVIHGGSLTELMRSYAGWQEHLLYNHQSQQHDHPSLVYPHKLFLQEHDEEDAAREESENRSSSLQKREKKDEDLAFRTETRMSESSSVSPGMLIRGDPKNHVAFPVPFSYPDMPPCGLPLALCKTIIQAILRGVAACHEHRIAHRDLKPDNILVEWMQQHPPAPPPPPPSPVSSAIYYPERFPCAAKDEEVGEDGHVARREPDAHLTSRSRAAEFAATAAELLKTKPLKRDAEQGAEMKEEREGPRSAGSVDKSVENIESGCSSIPARLQKGAVENKGGAHCVKSSTGRGNYEFPKGEDGCVVLEAKDGLTDTSTGPSQKEEAGSRASSEKTVEDDGSKDASQDTPPPYPPLPTKVVIADFGLARTLPFYISSSVMPKQQLSATSSTAPAVVRTPAAHKNQRGCFRQSKDTCQKKSVPQKKGKLPPKPSKSGSAPSQPDGDNSSGLAPGALHREKKLGRSCSGWEGEDGSTTERKSRKQSTKKPESPESDIQSGSDEKIAARTSFSLSPEIITLNYRPLDVLLGSSSYSLCVDVWSAGCILMELLTGTELIDGCSEFQCIMAIMRLFGNPWRRERRGKEGRSKEEEVTLAQGSSKEKDELECAGKREGDKEENGGKNFEEAPAIDHQNPEGGSKTSFPKNSRQTTLTRSSEWKFWSEALPAFEGEERPLERILLENGRVDALADPHLLDLASKLLEVMPDKRITAKEALRHPFFDDICIGDEL